MIWNINYRPQARKFLNKSDPQITKQIVKYLNSVAQNPKSLGESLTSNLRGLWRYRVGDYRIICDLQEKELLVLVVEINHRSKIYK